MLSNHFRREEFACKCGCGFDTVDAGLLRILEAARDYFDSPVIITSACRCMAHNERVGGAQASQHLLGRAADIIIKGADPEEVAEWFINHHDGGIGEYSTFTHVDSRSDRKARWIG